MLIEAQGGEKRAKYGDNLIKEYSIKLSKELGKNYSTRTLKYMRKFYLFQKGQPVVAQSQENIGQIQVYMNFINNNLKTVYHDNTIGLIICKKDNKYIIEYSSDPRIYTTNYEINE